MLFGEFTSQNILKEEAAVHLINMSSWKTFKWTVRVRQHRGSQNTMQSNALVSGEITLFCRDWLY